MDASPTRVGAALSHEYSQVDKDAYDVIFGVKKFYQYVYGREFTIIKDNKAISQIFAPDKGLPILSSNRMRILKSE